MPIRRALEDDEIDLAAAVKVRRAGIRLKWQLKADREMAKELHAYQERARILIDAGVSFELGKDITDEQLVEAKLILERRPKSELT